MPKGASVNFVCQRFLVDDCDTGGRLEVKFHLGNCGVFFPIAETKFCLYAARFADYYPNQARLRVGFEKNLIGRIVRRSIAGKAPEDMVTGRHRGKVQARFALVAGGGEPNGTAELGKISLPGQQSERGSPVRAFLESRATGRVISRNVEPDVRSVDNEELLFRRFILPAHAAGARKIDGARFGGRTAAAVRVALEKTRAESARVLVARFERAAQAVCVERNTQENRENCGNNR
jgi:hypothetical protein